jgi:hypothetical protein
VPRGSVRPACGAVIGGYLPADVGKDTRPPTGAIDTHKWLGAKHEHEQVPFGVQPVDLRQIWRATRGVSWTTSTTR